MRKMRRLENIVIYSLKPDPFIYCSDDYVLVAVCGNVRISDFTFGEILCTVEYQIQI